MDHELFALTALHAWGTRERMAWYHSRGNDLARLLAAVRASMDRVLDGRAPIAELDNEIELLQERLTWIRGELAAVEVLRRRALPSAPS